MYQNINRIHHNKIKWLKGYNGIKEAIERDATIIGCAETNIPWLNEHKQTIIQHAKNANAQKPILTTSNSILTGKSKHYQPGGIATIMHKKWTGRFVKEINDPRGCG